MLFRIKKNNRNKRAIYQNANSSFDFDYSVQSNTGKKSGNETSFKDANKNIDTSVTYEMKEIDYYA